MTQELILSGEIKVYEPFRATLVDLKKQNEMTVFNYESKQGNKEARSYIAKLRTSKAAVEKARKEEKAASLEYGRKVDAEAKQIIDTIESMIAVHKKPLDEIEEREEKRVAAIKDMIEGIKRQGECVGLSSGAIKGGIETLKSFAINKDSFEEFELEALKVRDAALAACEAELQVSFDREEQQAELERLRKEAAEREQKDREERIAREAAEKAQRDAEAKADAEKRAIEDAAKREREAAERRELEQKLALEKSQREAEQAKRDAETAAQRERERIEAEAKAEREKIAARERDIAHRKSIHIAALESLVTLCGIDEQQAKNVVTYIASGKIPNVIINY